MGINLNSASGSPSNSESIFKHPGFIPERFYTSPVVQSTSFSSSGLQIDTIYFLHVSLPDCTLISLAARVNDIPWTLGLGLYDTENSLPKNRVAYTGYLSGTGNVLAEGVVNIPITEGNYFLAIQGSDSESLGIYIATSTNNSQSYWIYGTTDPFETPIGGISYNRIYDGTLPEVFDPTVLTRSDNTTTPVVFFKIQT